MFWFWTALAVAPFVGLLWWHDRRAKRRHGGGMGAGRGHRGTSLNDTYAAGITDARAIKGSNPASPPTSL